MDVLEISARCQKAASRLISYHSGSRRLLRQKVTSKLVKPFKIGLGSSELAANITVHSEPPRWLSSAAAQNTFVPVAGEKAQLF